MFNRGSGCRLSAFSQIEDIAADSTGSVYMVDFGFTTSAVHRVVPGVGCVATWGDQGGPGGLTSAHSIAIDKDGFINVLDHNASGTFVRKYDREGSYVSSQQVGLPNESFSLALDFLHLVDDPFMYVARFNPNRVEVFGQGIEPRNVLETSWIDPTNFQLKTSDLDLLAECPTGPQDKRVKMKGVAADGVSPLLLRLHLPEPGTVRWKLGDPDHPGITENLGTLATLDSSDTGNAIDAPVDSVGNEFIAFAVYTAPIDFERPSVPADISVGERALRVTAEFTPDDTPDSVAIVSDLTIERPTVLFLHGFLEDSGRWGKFKSILTPADAPLWGDGKFILADYAATNGSPLAMNARKLQNTLNSVVSSSRSRGIASAQVDIISHSMGGLVLRRLADATPQDPFKFRSTANMGQGYYHKALFLNTPHQGSPLASILATIRDVMNSSVQLPTQRLAAWGLLHLCAKVFDAAFDQVVAGAIDDMRLGSDALANLQPFNAPIHSHVGTGGSDLWFTPRLLQAAAKREAVAAAAIATSFTNLPELVLYQTGIHDMAVLRDSQIGGLTNPGHYVTANFEDGLHESSLFSSISANTARAWATRSVGDASFFATWLPGGAGLASTPETRKWVHDLTRAVEEGMPEFTGETVHITTPSAGFVESSGDSFLVAVEPYSDVSRVVVAYLGGAVFMDSTLTGYAHTDSAFSGPFELSALALMADGTVGRSQAVIGTVRPPLSATLTGIEVTPLAVSLAGVGGVLELRVVGIYSDSVERDISSASAGTSYSGFNAGVASVNAEGVVRGAGAGTTTVTVRNGAYSQVVSVEVGDAPPINNRPRAVAGGPYQVCNGQGVTLDASASFDFDGDQLTFSWDLNGDGQFGDLAGATVSYSPPYIADERLIGLRVTDANGASSEDYTSIHVPLSCFEGERICAANVVAYEVSDLGTDGTGEVYIHDKLDTSGDIEKRDESCANDATVTCSPRVDPKGVTVLC